VSKANLAGIIIIGMLFLCFIMTGTGWADVENQASPAVEVSENEIEEEAAKEVSEDEMNKQAAEEEAAENSVDQQKETNDADTIYDVVNLANSIRENFSKPVNAQNILNVTKSVINTFDPFNASNFDQ
jgi:hypothetical protein